MSWITPSLAKKQEDWCNDLANRVRRLEEQGFNTETLQNNADFSSAVVQAMRIVLTADQRVKLQALQNAVLNIAVDKTPNADRRHILLGYVSQLTAAHLKILNFLHNPIKWMDNFQLSVPLEDTPQLNKILDYVLPELNADTNFFSVLITDLFNRGLITRLLETTFNIGIRPAQDRYGMGDALDPYQHITSSLGDEFLRFISSPLPDDELFIAETDVTETVHTVI